MTKDEALAKYGDVVVTFDSLYKGVATFQAYAPDGANILAYLGGATMEQAYYLTLRNNEQHPLEWFDYFTIIKDNQWVINVEIEY